MMRRRLTRLRSGVRTALASRLARRQVRLVLVVALAVGWLLSGLQIVLDYHDYRDTLHRQLDQLVEATASAAATAAWELNPDLGAVVCDGMIAHPAIGRCRLRLPSGTLLAEAAAEPATPWLPGAGALFGGERWRDVPLYHGMPRAIGYLALRITPTAAVDDFTGRVVTLLVTGTLRALILALVLFVAFYVLTTRPIARLSRFLDGLDPDALSGTLPPLRRHRHDDEIRQLEGSTLTLLETLRSQLAALQATRRSLQEVNDTLEAKVRSRTRELEQAMRTMHRQAHTDALTGLANRHALFAAGRRYLDGWQRYGEPCAVLLADLDHFKAINDRLGHDVGDRALKAVGALLGDSCRPGDLVARFGGEEFLVLLKVSNEAAAMAFAERLRRALAALSVEGIPWRLTASIGIAMLERDDTALETAIARADQAMYRAKQAGRDRVVTQAMRPATLDD